MYKRLIIVLIVTILVSMIFGPITISSESNEEIKSTADEKTTIFTSVPEIRLDYDSDAVSEEIIPINGSHEIPLQVSYEIYGMFSGWHEFVHRHKNVQVKLEIIDEPEWCKASLDTNTLNFDIKKKCSEPKNTSLFVSVDENAPAFQQGIIKIGAKSTSIKGLIFTKVASGNDTFEIPFIVGYMPVIDFTLSEGAYKEIPPLNTTTIPINITNLGNGRTEVIIEIIQNESSTLIANCPSMIVIDSPISGEENTKEVEISIKPYENFSMETIRIQLTPTYYQDPMLQGKPCVVTFTVKNDGSLKEKEEFEIDTTLLLVTIVVIVLIIIATILLKRKK